MLTKSSTELVRQQNSALVLASLRRHGPLAHTDISHHTGLASATVSVITAELEKAEVLERREQLASASRGRPRVIFGQRRDAGYLATVRISSDMVQYSLADYGGTLLDRFEEPRNHADTATRPFT
jgi:predicted ArsR family transcriptional regulator